MKELLEKLKSEARGAWRFRRQAILVAWAVCIIGWIAVLSLKEQYEAMARVYVDTRTPLRPLLQGLAVEQDVEAQLNMVRQALLGRPHLEKVARQTGLDDASRTPEERAAAVDGLGARIDITLVPPAIRNPRIPNTFFRIAYVDSEREKSIAVVKVLLDSFMEDTMGTKRAGAETAQRFLTVQLKDYERKLNEAEARLAEFKKRNLTAVPGTEGGFFERLQTELREIRRAESAIGLANSKKSELQRQLRGEVPFVASAGSTPANRTNGPDPGGGDTTSRILEVQTRLDEMLLNFTEKHPDVIALRETLTQLKERQQREIEALRNGTGTIATAATNPVYQNIQLQLNQTEVDMASLRREIVDRNHVVAELRAQLNTLPEMEAEYTRLTRDYDVNKSQYTALLERLERAQLSEDAEETGIVDFKIVDPPTAAFMPVFPNRPLFMAGVFFFALAAGGGVAYLLHAMKPVFTNGRSVTSITGLPVLGVVSTTWLEKQRLAMRNGLFRYAAAVGCLFVVFVAVVVTHESGAKLASRLLN